MFASTEELRRKYNLVEVSILLSLDKEYPKYAALNQIAESEREYAIIERYLKQMVEKGIIEKRWDKYKISKDTRKELTSFMQD